MFKRNLSFLFMASFLLFSGCEKSTDDTKAVGGNLPTTYIIIKDSAFTPNQLSIVAGNNITFLNQTATAQTIISLDGITIPSTVIAAKESFVFKKDTTGTFFYKNANQPNATGRFTLRP